MTYEISEKSLEILGENVAKYKGIAFGRLKGSMAKAGEKILEGFSGRQCVFNLQYVYLAAESLLNGGEAGQKAERIFAKMKGISQEKRRPFHRNLGSLLMQEYAKIENEFDGMSHAH